MDVSDVVKFFVNARKGDSTGSTGLPREALPPNFSAAINDLKGSIHTFSNTIKFFADAAKNIQDRSNRLINSTIALQESSKAQNTRLIQSIQTLQGKTLEIISQSTLRSLNTIIDKNNKFILDQDKRRAAEFRALEPLLKQQKTSTASQQNMGSGKVKDWFFNSTAEGDFIKGMMDAFSKKPDAVSTDTDTDQDTETAAEALRVPGLQPVKVMEYGDEALRQLCKLFKNCINLKPEKKSEDDCVELCDPCPDCSSKLPNMLPALMKVAVPIAAGAAAVAAVAAVKTAKQTREEANEQTNENEQINEQVNENKVGKQNEKVKRVTEEVPEIAKVPERTVVKPKIKSPYIEEVRTVKSPVEVSPEHPTEITTKAPVEGELVTAGGPPDLVTAEGRAMQQVKSQAARSRVGTELVARGATNTTGTTGPNAGISQSQTSGSSETTNYSFNESGGTGGGGGGPGNAKSSANWSAQERAAFDAGQAKANIPTATPASGPGSSNFVLPKSTQSFLSKLSPYASKLGFGLAAYGVYGFVDRHMVIDQELQSGKITTLEARKLHAYVDYTTTAATGGAVVGGMGGAAGLGALSMGTGAPVGALAGSYGGAMLAESLATRIPFTDINPAQEYVDKYVTEEDEKVEIGKPTFERVKNYKPGTNFSLPQMEQVSDYSEPVAYTKDQYGKTVVIPQELAGADKKKERDAFVQKSVELFKAKVSKNPNLYKDAKGASQFDVYNAEDPNTPIRAFRPGALDYRTELKNDNVNATPPESPLPLNLPNQSTENNSNSDTKELNSSIKKLTTVMEANQYGGDTNVGSSNTTNISNNNSSSGDSYRDYIYLDRDKTRKYNSYRLAMV